MTGNAASNVDRNQCPVGSYACDQGTPSAGIFRTTTAMIAAMTMPMSNEIGLAAGGAFGGAVGGAFTGAGGGAIVELMEFSPMSANAWQAFPRGFSVQT